MNNQIPHIGIFGKRNVGKSSFINVLCEQSVSIVSEQAGTTTDPVKKRIELGECGPVVLIDTAGIDDNGDVGEMRVAASRKVFSMIDMGIIVLSNNSFDDYEREIISSLDELNTPYIIIHNKTDISKMNQDLRKELINKYRLDESEIVEFNSLSFVYDSENDSTNNSNRELINLISKTLPESIFNNPTIIGDLVNYGDVVLLVTPVDKEAPKGRMILPQVQVIRDAIDNGCIVITLRETELEYYFNNCKLTPKLVITDSQAFAMVDAIVPKDIPLTSFSILFARLKGDFNSFVKGTYAISNLKDNDRILIMESCSHHTIGDDIARVKLPKWINEFTEKKLEYEVVTAFDQPSTKYKSYALMIQCGGCMFTRKQIINRMQPALKNHIPITNYGMAIAYTKGIFQRSLSPFKFI
ncbi:MAG: [FeFe] hydrogenase H-cluster maturation GTPase HydF [Oligoflexia bacterium]|nr:[FeFe] hydrogenase H-cluster maturation GTPase HydF [Oligoflexia bacterium]